MKIEIDTVKKEIVVHEAIAEELIDILNDYLKYKVVSNISFHPIPMMPTQPYAPYDPYDPYTPHRLTEGPWCSTTSSSPENPDIINKKIFE